MKIIVLLSMFFLHIVDDYYLQGILASLKQKSWWEKNAPDKLYKYDYLIALLEHAFSWSFMVHVPIMIYLTYFGKPLYELPFTILANMIIHAFIDDKKANRHSINLITDQLLHFIQILTIFLFYLNDLFT